jgi:hypothetical protein
MQDRVPLYPGRVTLTPVAGQENTFDMARADQPTQEGTPINKATLLKDVTASILGLPNTAVPDDAFLALTIGIGTYGYRVKIQLADGTPVEGATVSGITALTGSTLVSGADGIVLGKSTSQTVTISCTSPYIDQAPPANQTITSVGTITDATIVLTEITDTITITNSKNVKASPNAKTMDITAVGGGGGGGSYNYYCGGGGGGNILHALNIGLSSTDIKISIGSGGSAGSREKPAGASGGTTDVKFNGTNGSIVSATGGGGGASTDNRKNFGGSSLNGGKGGDGATSNNTSGGGAGDASVVHIFDDPNLPIAGGGGGGGGGYTGGNGGAPYGGHGGGSGGGGVLSSGRQPGGGGGGTSMDHIAGASGANGGVYLRFYF